MVTTAHATEAPILINSREAARLLGISERTVYQLRQDGNLPFVKVRGAVRFDRRALSDFVSGQTKTIGQPS